MIPRHQHPAYPEWAHEQVRGLPFRWQKRLVNRWNKTRKDAGEGSAANRAAAHELLGTLGALHTVNIPLDASDADICARAEAMARHCTELAQVFHGKEALRGAMARVCASNHIDAPTGKKITPEGAIARMTCPQWWRRQLRKLHAKAVEGAAIAMGYVNKTRDCYVSNESVERRRQQNKRNAAALENTKAINEEGQEFTLAELAAKGVANKAIRRGELMTRIAGFERIAVDCRHVGLFFTMTCPSRMHKWKTVDGGKVVENPKYDGTNPNDAQAYLRKTWSRIRAKLARCDFQWYGFRIAEPNHDGTPHWHCLVFFDPSWQGSIQRSALPRLCAIIRHYALRESGSERGAKAHRVDFKPMDAGKGTAAGYIAKYVAKNIDGYGLEKDLYGNDAFTTSQRVEAWAATWRIRQFQQIGGAPVTVWRELRRVDEIPDGAPEFMQDAHRACNKIAQVEGENASVAWHRYVTAQGGVFIGRSYRIRLALEEREGNGRYGDALAPAPVGVEAISQWVEADGIIPNAAIRIRKFFAKSARHVWEIVRSGVSKIDAAARRAWTCVNNCTRENFADLTKKINSVKNSDAAGVIFEFCGPINWPAIEKSINDDARSTPFLTMEASV
jgi:hypothetical protein